MVRYPFLSPAGNNFSVATLSNSVSSIETISNGGLVTSSFPADSERSYHESSSIKKATKVANRRLYFQIVQRRLAAYQDEVDRMERRSTRGELSEEAVVRLAILRNEVLEIQKTLISTMDMDSEIQSKHSFEK